MKKKSIWFIITVLMLFVTALSSIIYALNITENIQIITILIVSITIFAGISIAIFAQRKICNASLKSRRKYLLIVLGVFIVLLLTMIITDYIEGRNPWQDFNNRGFIGLLLVIVFAFFYGFFRKGKKQKLTDNNQTETE